jgi:hypothetical protein
MPGVLDLQDVLDLLNDSLNESSLPDQDLIKQRHQLILDSNLSFGYSLQALYKEQVKQLPKISFSKSCTGLVLSDNFSSNACLIIEPVLNIV